jgi:PTH1 family peptidyl-tRNA hydrolase
MKVVCGLGNPGEEYAETRHNVGWWVLDAARSRWRFPAYRREGRARSSEGSLDGEPVRLVKPLTFMNRSGSVVARLATLPDFETASDLLVVVDDAALDVGRIRFRAQGSAGGHNGLRSIESSLRSQEYARLRIGVGGPPPDVEMADWVLSDFEEEEEAGIRDLLPDLVEAVGVWVTEGVEPAANRFNR